MSFQRSPLYSNYADEFSNLKAFGTGWWHVTMGVLVPLAVALLETGACNCSSPTTSRDQPVCTCRRARLVRPPVAAGLLAAQMAMLPCVELVEADRRADIVSAHPNSALRLELTPIPAVPVGTG